MSQAQLARTIGKTEMWVSLRLRGKQPIDLNDLSLIAGALGVGVHDLLPQASRGAGTGRRDADLNDSSRQLNPSADARPAAARQPAARPSRHLAVGGGPYGGGRRDAVRPVSAIPASKRRPTQLGPGVRPIPL